MVDDKSVKEPFTLTQVQLDQLRSYEALLRGEDEVGMCELLGLKPGGLPRWETYNLFSKAVTGELHEMLEQCGVKPAVTLPYSSIDLD